MHKFQGHQSTKRDAHSQTLIYVPIDRLTEEYEAGKEDQRTDEFLRKQYRIIISFCITMLAIIGNVLDFGSNSIYFILLINFLMHIIL